LCPAKLRLTAINSAIAGSSSTTKMVLDICFPLLCHICFVQCHLK
jgi:hypothetical protein